MTGRHVRLGPDGQPERPTSGPDSLGVITGRCICGTPGIDYDGPDIECPQHGDPDRVTCPYCDGRGEARWPGELWVCSACGGNGWPNGTATLGQYLGGGVFAPPEPCDTCHGTGTAPDHARKATPE